MFEDGTARLRGSCTRKGGPNQDPASRCIRRRRSIFLLPRLPDAIVPETPFAVAIQSSAFNLSNILIDLRADVNAFSKNCAMVGSTFPMTILGHIAASTARNTIPRLNFLLNECTSHESVAFIVEPERQLTALQPCRAEFRRYALPVPRFLRACPDDQVRQ
jgi:hypothetical protein